VVLPKLLQWYGPDFGPTPTSRLAALLPFLPPSRRAELAGLLEAGPGARRLAISYCPYDWSPNGDARLGSLRGGDV
jgi:hypothetical protein